jgi:hypothetical protein
MRVTDGRMTGTTTLTSNGSPISFDDTRFGSLRDSTEQLRDPEALRRNYRQDGYLYLRGVLDPAELRWLRGRYFSRFDPGYLRAGTDPADGVYSGREPRPLPPHGVRGHPAYDFVRTSEFRRFAASPALVRLAGLVLDGQAEQLPRQIVRHFRRDSGRASRAHRDYDYLDAGSEIVTTIWIPIGACPLEAGGLVYLERSHELTAQDLEHVRQVSDRPDDRRPISHDLAWVVSKLGRKWLWADYAAGDLTLHAPRTVHASLDNTSDHMRLSADLRFIRRGEPADPRWTVPWAGDDGN